jgi:hypothetical protein
MRQRVWPCIAKRSSSATSSNSKGRKERPSRLLSTSQPSTHIGHIDVFCGADESNCLPDLIASEEDQTFKAYIVTDPALVSKLKILHTL